MSYPNCQELLLREDAGILTITLNRPHKRNAMNERLVSELSTVFTYIEPNRAIRAVVLHGAGGNFCAGGDISGMHDQTEGDKAAAESAMWEFNRSFGRMVTQANRAPQVVIALLEGAVLGGGLGLACISDVAIADTKAKMGMPETGLGIIPAQIAPFVVARIGLTAARKMALLADWVDGIEAKSLGIAHYVTDGADAMEAELASVLKKLKKIAPGANALTKKLLLSVGAVEHEALLDQAADWFAEALGSAEGIEGTAAFVEKRQPSWAEDA